MKISMEGCSAVQVPGCFRSERELMAAGTG